MEDVTTIFIDNITDWLMVIITFIYVIATCIICWANLRSTKATREQIEEQKQQFDETNRPYLDISTDIIRGGLMVIKVKNIGLRSARNATLSINSEFLDKLETQTIRENLIAIKNHSFYIGVGQKCLWAIGGYHDEQEVLNVPLVISVTYSGTLANYSDTVSISLSQYGEMLLIQPPPEDISQHIKDISKHIKAIAEK